MRRPTPSAFVVPLLFALALAPFAGCDRDGGNGSKANGTTGPTTGGGGGSNNNNNTGDIVIGHYGSLTGSEATFGLSTSNGVKLAIREVNAAGGVNGRKVVLKEYDDKGDARETGSVVTRLVANDKVVAVIGEVASGLSLAGAPICQQYQVPMISPSSTNERVTMAGDMIFRVCFIDDFQGYVGAKFARDDLKAKKAAVLFDQAAPYSVGLGQSFKTHFTAMGGQISTEQPYNAGDQDFSARLNAIRATNPDVIYVPGYYTDIANIAIQARKLDIKTPLLGGDGWDSAKLAEIAGPAIEGSFYSNHAAPQGPPEEMKEFVQKYTDEYGQSPDALAGLGYDAANLVFDAMRRSPSLGGKDLAAAIAATRDFGGVTGKITIDAKRNAVKPAVILELKNGQPTYVTTIEPPK